MIQSLKIHAVDDGSDTVATVTAYVDNGLILRGIKIVRDDNDELKVDRDTRPLFMTKELRKLFCEEVLTHYRAGNSQS